MYLLWLILYINLIGLQGAQTFSNIILGVLMRAIPDEINIFINRLSKEVKLSLLGLGMRVQTIKDLNATKRLNGTFHNWQFETEH